MVFDVRVFNFDGFFLHVINIHCHLLDLGLSEFDVLLIIHGSLHVEHVFTDQGLQLHGNKVFLIG
jgi:hypothetical protein